MGLGLGFSGIDNIFNLHKAQDPAEFIHSLKAIMLEVAIEPSFSAIGVSKEFMVQGLGL